MHSPLTTQPIVFVIVRRVLFKIMFWSNLIDAVVSDMVVNASSHPDGNYVISALSELLFSIVVGITVYILSVVGPFVIIGCCF